MFNVLMVLKLMFHNQQDYKEKSDAQLQQISAKDGTQIALIIVQEKVIVMQVFVNVNQDIQVLIVLHFQDAQIIVIIMVNVKVMQPVFVIQDGLE